MFMCIFFFYLCGALERLLLLLMFFRLSKRNGVYFNDSIAHSTACRKKNENTFLALLQLIAENNAIFLSLPLCWKKNVYTYSFQSPFKLTFHFSHTIKSMCGWHSLVYIVCDMIYGFDSSIRQSLHQLYRYSERSFSSQ